MKLLKKVSKNSYIHTYFPLLPILIIFVVIAGYFAFTPYRELIVYSYLVEKGLVPYKQVIDQHFPGVMLFPLNLASFGLDNISNLRYLHLSINALNIVLFYHLALKLFKSRKSSSIVTIIYLLMLFFFEGYVLWIESFITPLVLASFILLQRRVKDNKYIVSKNKISLFSSGFLLGLAFLLKQQVILVVAAVLLYLLKRSRRKELCCVMAGVLLPVGYLLFYLIDYKVIEEFIYWTFTFNLNVYSRYAFRVITLQEMFKLFAVFAFAVFSLIALLKSKLKFTVILSVYFIPLLILGYGRYDFIHFQPALPFALILINLYLLNIQKEKLTLLVKSAFYITIATLFLTLFLSDTYPRSHKYKLDYSLNNQEKMAVKSLKIYVNKDDTLYDLSSMDILNQLTDTLPPGNRYYPKMSWYLQVLGVNMVKNIEENPPDFVVISEAKYNSYDQLEYLGEIKKYIDNNYHFEKKINNQNLLFVKK
jgi:hypothetical protein